MHIFIMSIFGFGLISLLLSDLWVWYTREPDKLDWLEGNVEELEYDRQGFDTYIKFEDGRDNYFYGIPEVPVEVGNYIKVNYDKDSNIVSVTVY